MPMFVTGRVAIGNDGVMDEKDITTDKDVMFIRPKMDYGTQNRVVGEAAKIKQQQQARQRPQRGQPKAKPKNDVEFDVGAYQTALLKHNVLGWVGPSFVGVPCTPENIERLDPDEPLVKVVIDEITNRNAPADADAPELDDPNVIEVSATVVGGKTGISTKS